MPKSANIRRLIELEQRFDKDHAVIWEFEGKQVKAWSLKNIPEVAVAEAVLPAGVEFPIHKHDESEILICFSGRADCVVQCGADGEAIVPLTPGKCVYLLPKVAHCIRAKEETRFIAVTVPAAPGFPTEALDE
jgi:mannose-6-phosphate isomerase-like protein (cupin superfamily)